MKEGNFLSTKMVDFKNEKYPKLLNQINDAPKKIYYRGNLDICNKPTLAVVGSRKYSSYGKLVCQQIVGPLSRMGITIVSGLALGIDGIAHKTTLENNGDTIAVLGSGINRLTPTSHDQLAKKILDNNGLIISEYPDDLPPTKYTFPARNRIIAGLSLGCLVIEAAKKSGALITAHCALDYNREVFSIPHPINSTTGKGANKLIKIGAQLVDEYQTIVTGLGLEEIQPKNIKTNNISCDKQEKAILKHICDEPRNIDYIAKQTKLDISVVNGKLSLLEIRGIIKNLGETKYVVNL